MSNWGENDPVIEPGKRSWGQSDPEIPLKLARVEEEKAGMLQYARTPARHSSFNRGALKAMGVPEAAYTDAAATLVGLGSSVVAPVARNFGQDETADRLNRFGDAYEQAAGEQDQKGVIPPILKRAVRGAAKTLPTSIVAGRFAGPYGAMGIAALQERDQAITEARDMGMSEPEVQKYAATQGAIEFIVGAAFQRLGLGGLESAVSRQAASKGIAPAAKQALKDALAELPEENITEIGHLVARAAASGKPLTGEQIWETVKETSVQTAVTLGAVEAPNIAASGVTGADRGKRLAQLKELRAAKPFISAEDAQTAGIPGETRKERLSNTDSEIKQLEQEIQNEVPAEAPVPEVRQAAGVQGQVSAVEVVPEEPQVPDEIDPDVMAAVLAMDAAEAAALEAPKPQEEVLAQGPATEPDRKFKTGLYAGESIKGMLEYTPKKNMGKKPPESLPEAPQQELAPEPAQPVPTPPVAPREAEKPVKRRGRKDQAVTPEKPPEPAAIQATAAAQTAAEKGDVYVVPSINLAKREATKQALGEAGLEPVPEKLNYWRPAKQAEAQPVQPKEQEYVGRIADKLIQWKQGERLTDPENFVSSWMGYDDSKQASIVKELVNRGELPVGFEKRKVVTGRQILEELPRRLASARYKTPAAIQPKEPEAEPIPAKPAEEKKAPPPELAKAGITIKNTPKGWSVTGIPKEIADGLSIDYQGKRTSNGVHFKKDPTQALLDVSGEIAAEAEQDASERAAGRVKTSIGFMEPETAQAFEQVRSERLTAAKEEVQRRNDGVDQLVGQFVPQGQRGQFKLKLLRARGTGDAASMKAFDQMVQYSKDHPELGLPSDETKLFNMLSGESFKQDDSDILDDIDEELAKRLLEDGSFDFGANADEAQESKQTAIPGTEEAVAAQQTREEYKQAKQQPKPPKQKQKAFISGMGKDLPGQKTAFDVDGLDQPTSLQQDADKALQEANDELKSFVNKVGKTPNIGFNPELAAGAARVVLKFARAGFKQFQVMIDNLKNSVGQPAVDKIQSLLELAWDKAQSSGRFPGMEPRMKPDTTSVKHRKTDEIREKIGMPPRDVSTMSHDEMRAEAAWRMKEDPELAANLAEKVARKPQTVDGVEHLILSLHIRDLMNRREAGEDVLGDLVTAVTAARESGREVARSLGSRKVELNPDFTIADYIKRHLEAFDEQPSAKWLAKYEEMAAQVKEAEEQARSALRKLAEAEAEAAIRAAQQPQKPAKRGTKKAQRAERRSEAVANFKKEWSTLYQLHAAPDPKTEAEKWHKLTLAAGKLVKVYVESGVESALEFIGLVKADMGEISADQEKALREAWATAKVSPLGGNPEPSEIGAFAKYLMRMAVEQGIEGRDNVVDAVQEELQAAGVDLSREETMLAMSDYGIYRELAKDAVSVKVREYRGELQQLMKLKDIEAGQVPSLTGVEQRKPSADETRLRHDVYEGMKRLGLSTQDNRQVTTPLSSKQKAVEKRLGEVDDEIRQLTDNIKQGTPLKPDGTRTELVVNEELVELQSKLDAAYLERDELRKQSPAWQALETSKAMEKYEESLRRSLEYWEGRLSSARRGILPEKQKPSRFANEFLEAKAKLAEVQSETLAEIEREKRRRWNLGQKIGHGLAEVSSDLPRTLMAGLEMSVVLRQGYFYTHAHPLMSLFNVVNSLGSVFSRRYALAQDETLSERPNFKEYKGLDFTLESGPRDHLEELFQSNTMKWLSRTKSMYLLPPRLIAKSYEAFNRGVRVFANTMKADLFDITKRDTLAGREFFSKWGIGKQGWDQEDIDTSARTANILSGRGTGLKSGATFVDWLFFARRWVWSRVQAEFILPFQLVTPKFIGQWNADPAMRVAHAKLYGQAAIGAATHLAVLYFIMKMMQDDDEETDDEPTVEFSWISSDFVKLKVGDTRFDVMGGLPQLLTLMGRIVTGKTKNSRGEIKNLRGPDRDYGAPGVWEAATQALRYKLGPSASGIVDFFTGRTAVGEELPEEPLRRAAGIVGDRMTPMAYGDMWEAEKELGLKRGTVTAIEAFFGASVNTHGDRTKFRNADEAGRKKMIFSAFERMDVSKPKRKNFGSDEKFEAATTKFTEDNERATEEIRWMADSLEEARVMLKEYYLRTDSSGKRGSLVDKQTGELKDSYLKKLRVLTSLFK